MAQSTYVCDNVSFNCNVAVFMYKVVHDMAPHSFVLLMCMCTDHYALLALAVSV